MAWDRWAGAEPISLEGAIRDRSAGDHVTLGISGRLDQPRRRGTLRGGRHAGPLELGRSGRRVACTRPGVSRRDRGRTARAVAGCGHRSGARPAPEPIPAERWRSERPRVREDPGPRRAGATGLGMDSEPLRLGWALFAVPRAPGMPWAGPGFPGGWIAAWASGSRRWARAASGSISPGASRTAGSRSP